MEFVDSRIGALCAKITDGSHFSPGNDSNGEYPMYSVKDMEYNGFAKYGYKTIGKDVFDKLSKADCRPLKNDVLIAKDGSYLKYAFKVNNDLDACVLSSIAILRPNIAKINPDYFVYLLRTKSVKSAMANYVSGSALPRIILSDFKKMRIKVAKSIEEQKNIADILVRYDALIENNNKRIRLLERMAENLYKEWFIRFRFPGHEKMDIENGLPKGWCYQRLDAIASIIMGQSPSSSFYNEEQKGLPFHQGVGSYGDIYLKDEVYSTQGAKVAEPNSIIFSVRAPVGRINITQNRIYLGRGVAAINSVNGNNGFLYWNLRNKFAKEDTIGNGAIFSSVTRDELGRQKMLVPSKLLVSRFESVANKVEKLIRDITAQNKSLTRQRDLLLPRLMSGKIEVKQ